MKLKLTNEQRDYLSLLSTMPQVSPEFWPKHMVELYSGGLIQKIGKCHYLTESGWSMLDACANGNKISN